VEGEKIEDENNVILASTFMRGDAEKWVMPIVERYIDSSVTDSENSTLMEDWDLFKEKIK
jgi:hypothetical protein